MLEAKGRVKLHLPCSDWVAKALATPGPTLVQLTPQIAIESSRLPSTLQSDPADRIIAATARCMGASFVTFDESYVATRKTGTCGSREFGLRAGLGSAVLYSARRAFSSFLINAAGGALSSGKRIVPLSTSYFFSSSLNFSMTLPLAGKRLQWLVKAA
jgi:hypothetical protein